LVGVFISDELEGDKTNTVVADDGIGYLPWRNAEFVFNSIKPFFDCNAYSASILKGLITSSGGLTESTLKASQKSLFEHLQQMGNNTEQKKKFIGKLCYIFESCHR